MARTSRRTLLRASAGLVLGALAGCLSHGADPATEQPENADGPSATPETTPTSDGSSTRSPSGGVHGSSYDVTIRVVARKVDDDSVAAAEVTSLNDGNVTRAEREALVDVIEGGETEAWSGTNEEVPPRELRDLVALTDRLPPSRAERDPADAWRVARETTAYLEYAGTIYRVGMLKVAP